MRNLLFCILLFLSANIYAFDVDAPEFKLKIKEGDSSALKVLKEEAERGNPRAQCLLGRRYLNGWKIEKNSDEGIKWLKRAIEQGDLEAQCNLGVCYIKGLGVKEDLNKDFPLIKTAAEKKHPYG